MTRLLACAVLIVTAGVVVAADAQLRRLPEGAAILGQVMDAQTGQGLDRVIVEVDGADLRRQLVADGRGRFLFTGLPAGEYLVRARRTGYLQGVFGQRRATGDGQVVSVAHGQWLSDIDMTLWRPGVITGDVRDDRGEPMAGVTVHAYRHDLLPLRTMLREVSRTVTDDTGRYRLQPLSPGDHVVGIATGTEGEVVFAPQYYPGTDRVAGAVTVTVEAGREFAGIGFMLHAPALLSVAGRVDTSGLPADRIDALRLHLARPPDSWIIEPSAHRVLSVAVPDPDGHFRFPEVPGGDYVIEAAFADPDVMEPSVFWTATPIVVSDRSVDDIAISLQPGLTVEGRVSPPTPTGLTIRFTPLFDAAGSRDVIVRSSEDGTFHSGPSLVPGRYLVSVSGLPPEVTVQSVSFGGLDVSDKALDLTSGFSVAGLLVELTDQQTLLSGTVRSSVGQPFRAAIASPFADPHSTVLLFPESNPAEGARRVHAVRTGPDGAFAFRSLPPGSYLVVAIDDAEAEGWQAADRLQVLRRRATPVTLREGEARMLELRRVPSR